MLKELKEYLKPRSVEEAWAMFQDPSKGPALFLTGGLSVAQREDQTTRTLIDLSGLLGDSISETDTDYILDGNATVADCIGKIDLPFLREALHMVGSRQIRNMSSMAGTLGQRYSWSDTITALLALDAYLEGYNGNTVTIPLDRYLKDRTPLLITKVMIPKRYNRGAFFKFSHISYDIATLNLAIVFRIEREAEPIEETVVQQCRIACGARPGIAIILPRSGAAIQGKTFSTLRKDLPPIQSIAAIEASVASSADASAEYRQQLVRAYVERGVLRLIGAPAA